MTSLVVYGRPTTKKNSSRVVMTGKYPRVLPSKAYAQYEQDCLKQLQFFKQRAHVSGPVVIRCRYYMPDFRSWPDLVGLLQATSDILTTACIIDDDMWITSYDGSEIVGVDKNNPRVEIDIMEAHPPHVIHEIWNRRKANGNNK